MIVRNWLLAYSPFILPGIEFAEGSVPDKDNVVTLSPLSISPERWHPACAVGLSLDTDLKVWCLPHRAPDLCVYVLSAGWQVLSPLPFCLSDSWVISSLLIPSIIIKAMPVVKNQMRWEVGGRGRKGLENAGNVTPSQGSF